jgi:multidrug efflux pump subunit AcrA (membrane-fusion protein)
MKRAACVSMPVAIAVIVGTTFLVMHGSEPAMTLTAKVDQGPVSRMFTAKGVVSAADTADLNFQSGLSNVHEVDVKVGDSVKRGQKLAELDDGGLRRGILQAQQALAQQQAALNQLLRDFTPEADRRAYEQARSQAAQAWRNVKLKYSADLYAAHTQEHMVHMDERAEDKAKWKLRADDCNPDGTPASQNLVTSTTTTPPSCPDDKAAVDAADLTRFKDARALGSDYRTAKVDRGTSISTYRSARATAVGAYNTWTIARTNRPTQIQAQQALVANALVNVTSAQGHLDNNMIFAPIDGVVSAINGRVGEFSNGGDELTPDTPLAPGGTAKIPTTGSLASLDQHNLTGGQGPNLGLQNVLPGGNTFIQLSNINAFSVVAAFPQDVVAQIGPGAHARVAFDAFPGAASDGTVTAVSPIGTPGGPDGAPTYYATVMLDKTQIPDHLKSGLTANVSVVTSTIENKAMVVPTDAVSHDDGRSFVEVPEATGPVKKPFTPGQVGDDNTQVLAGLRKGDTVMIPSTGPLPAPSDAQPPHVPPAQPLTFEHIDPPATKAAPAQSNAVPAAPPAGAAGTYPGDPGDISDPDAAMDAPAPNSGSTANADGINPFATPAPSSPN